MSLLLTGLHMMNKQSAQMLDYAIVVSVNASVIKDLRYEHLSN